MKENLTAASDGIASLEEFQATCTARLDALEGPCPSGPWGGWDHKMTQPPQKRIGELRSAVSRKRREKQFFVWMVGWLGTQEESCSGLDIA